jgi:capsule polysaccharide export protein KpsE/RkpR
MAREENSHSPTAVIDQNDELAALGYSVPVVDRATGWTKMEPIEIAWLLWGKRKLFKWILLASLVVFTAIAFLVPKTYEATAQLMPPDFSSSTDLLSALPMLAGGGDDAGGAAGAAAAAGGGVMGLANKLLGLDSPGQLMIGVLGSRTISDSIIERFGLTDVYSTSYPEDTRKKLDDYTDFKEDSKSGIISIIVEDKSPERAAAMAKAYTDELNRVLADVSTSSAHRERVFVEQRLAEVKTELDRSVKELSQFSSQNTTIDITEQAKAMVGAAADLQGELIAAQSMLRGMQQIYTDSNPRIRQLQAQIVELQNQLQKIGGKDVKATDGAALGKDELYPSIRQLPLLGVRYLDLYRQSKINEAVFELLTKEYEVVKLQEARNMPTVEVLDQPVVPQKKAHPSRLLIIVGGMGFCLLVSMTWIVGAAQWDRTAPEHPWKEFAEEVCNKTKAGTWDSPRGRRIRARFTRKRGERLAGPPDQDA